MSSDTSEQAAGRGHRVTPLELFFDLVVVFAFTQVTTFLTENATWSGLGRGLLLLAVIWWAWSAYAWLTNMLDPEEGGIRLAMFAATGAMLVVSLAAPHAFGRDAMTFAVAYLIVRLLHLMLFAKAGRGDRDLLGAVVRTLPGSTLAPALLVIAGIVEGSARVSFWCVAVAILYLSPLIGHMRGFRVSPEHFVERYGLIVIIALGESIVAIGLGVAGRPLDGTVIEASLLGLTVAACLWWSYFDWAVYVGQARLAEATGQQRAAFARDAYAYLHLPMVAGIVLFAFGLKATLHDVGAPLGSVQAVGLCGGIALYFLAHVGVRLRIGGGLGRGRPIAALVLLAVIPLATRVSALGALGIVAGVCVGVIAYEYLRHRESRNWIRSRRGEFTMEEATQVVEPRRPRRPRRGKGSERPTPRSRPL